MKFTFLTAATLVLSLVQVDAGPIERAPLFNFEPTTIKLIEPIESAAITMTRSQQNLLYCLSLRNGELLWKRSLTNSQRIATSERFLLIASWDGTVEALESGGAGLSSPHPISKRSFGTNIELNPLIDGETAYIIGWNDRIYKWNFINDQILWTSPRLESRIHIDPVVSAAGLIAATSNGSIYCLDDKDGWVAWRAKFTARASAPPIIGQGNLILATDEKRLVILNLSTGKTMTEFELPAQIAAKPVSDDESIYLTLSDNRLLAINLRTMQIIWELPLRTAIVTPPALSQGALVLAGGDIMIVRSTDGKVALSYNQDLNRARTDALEEMRWNSASAITAEASAGIPDRFPAISGEVIRITSTTQDHVAIELRDGSIYLMKLSGSEEHPKLQLSWLFRPALRIRFGLLPSTAFPGRYRSYYVAGDDTIYSLDLTDSTSAPQVVTMGGGFQIAPTIADTDLLVTLGRDAIIRLSGIDDRIVDRVTLDDPILTAPVQLGTSVFFYTSNGTVNLTEWSGADKLRSIQLPAEETPLSTPIASGSGQFIYAIAQSGAVYCWAYQSVQSATWLWVKKFASDPVAVLDCRAAGSGIGFGYLDHQGRLVLCSETGDEIWSIASGIVNKPITGPIWVGAAIVIVDPQGSIVVVDSTTRKIHRRIKTPSAVTGRVALNELCAVVPCKDELFLVSLTDGEIRWHHKNPSQYLDPVIIDDRIFVPTKDGAIVGFNLDD